MMNRRKFFKNGALAVGGLGVLGLAKITEPKQDRLIGMTLHPVREFNENGQIIKDSNIPKKGLVSCRNICVKEDLLIFIDNDTKEIESFNVSNNGGYILTRNGKEIKLKTLNWAFNVSRTSIAEFGEIEFADEAKLKSSTIIIAYELV